MIEDALLVQPFKRKAILRHIKFYFCPHKERIVRAGMAGRKSKGNRYGFLLQKLPADHIRNRLELSAA